MKHGKHLTAHQVSAYGLQVATVIIPFQYANFVVGGFLDQYALKLCLGEVVVLRFISSSLVLMCPTGHIYFHSTFEDNLLD